MTTPTITFQALTFLAADAAKQTTARVSPLLSGSLQLHCTVSGTSPTIAAAWLQGSDDNEVTWADILFDSAYLSRGAGDPNEPTQVAAAADLRPKRNIFTSGIPVDGSIYVAIYRFIPCKVLRIAYGASATGTGTTIITPVLSIRPETGHY